MNEEGVIKFQCHHIQASAPEDHLIAELNEWRNRLYELSLIGVTPDGIGYGNMSIRKGKGFIITGSGTGSIRQMDRQNYVEVTGHSISSNYVECRGLLLASSESLTHAVIYDTLPDAGAVFHVHHQGLWKKLLSTHPSTPAAIPYGTPEMAAATRELVMGNDIDSRGIFAMGGHVDGVVCFGKDPGDAGALLLSFM